MRFDVLCHNVGCHTHQLRAGAFFIVFGGAGAGNGAALSFLQPQQLAADDGIFAVAAAIFGGKRLHLGVGGGFLGGVIAAVEGA